MSVMLKSPRQISPPVLEAEPAALSHAEVQRLTAMGEEMVALGLAGHCVPLATDAGEQVVAILDTEGERIICAFGKIGAIYCAIDAGSRVLGHGGRLEDILAVFPYVFGPHPELAKIPGDCQG